MQLGVPILLFVILLTGCTSTKEVKLRHAIECRSFADRDLSELKKTLSDKSWILLEESFYSDVRGSCVASFKIQQYSEDASGGPHFLMIYSAYDSISNKKLAEFARLDYGKSMDTLNTKDEEPVPIEIDADVAMENRLRQWH